MKITLGVVRGISYGVFGPPDTFVPQTRALGATLVRAYVYWAQVEPSPGRYDWSAVDALLDQLGGTGGLAHGLLQLAVGHPGADRLPAAVAGPRRRRVRAVRRRAGPPLRRPGPLLAVQQRAEQHRPALVRDRRRIRRPAGDLRPRGQDADPAARGRPRRLRLRRARQPARQPAAAVLRRAGRSGRDAFDLFSVHLYDDPRRVPEHLDTARGVHAGARVRAAAGRRRAQRPDAVRLPGRDGGARAVDGGRVRGA